LSISTLPSLTFLSFSSTNNEADTYLSPNNGDTKANYLMEPAWLHEKRIYAILEFECHHMLISEVFQREELRPSKFYGSWMKLSLDIKKGEV